MFVIVLVIVSLSSVVGLILGCSMNNRINVVMSEDLMCYGSWSICCVIVLIVEIIVVSMMKDVMSLSGVGEMIMLRSESISVMMVRVIRVKSMRWYIDSDLRMVRIC